MPLRVWIDHGTCIACGICSTLSPQVFEGNEEGKAIVVAQYRTGADGAEGRIPEDLRDAAIQAMEACPTKSIHVEE